MKKKSKRVSFEQRAAEKRASRRADRARLANGESPEVLQRENSIFPPDYFKHCQIVNFASAIGK